MLKMNFRTWSTLNAVEMESYDETLAASVNYDTALRGYFTEKADGKPIPTNAKGFRVWRKERIQVKATEYNYLYLYRVEKNWSENGRCSTRYAIQPISSVDTLIKELNESYGPDDWGNFRAGFSAYENRKRVNVSLGDYDKNPPRLKKLIDGWLEKGYRLFPANSEPPVYKLDKEQRKDYRA